MSEGRVEAVNRSPGGVPKKGVARCRVTRLGLEGDRQRHRRIHGGPLRAVCLYSAEHIAALRAEGHSITAGSTGENLTLSGLDWAQLQPGVRLRAGGVGLEITSYADPCRTIAGSFAGGACGRISQKTHPGWSRLYARVLEEGEVGVGDPVALRTRRSRG